MGPMRATDRRRLLSKRVRTGLRLLAAIAAGVGVAMVPVHSDAQGDRSASPSKPEAAQLRVDYQGRPFVTQRAPTLKFEARTSPHPYGIDYPFAEQTARGVALFSRFPAFTLSDRRIHMSGPWYDSMEANLHFSRGITSVEAMPNFRQGPADVRNLAPAHKWLLLTDPLFWSYAMRWANELKSASPDDPRIAVLTTFARDHKFTPDEGVFTELGRRVWLSERSQLDSEGKGARRLMVDIEQTGGWEHQRNCFGWIYAGLVQGAKETGSQVIPVTYGQWTFSVGTFYQSMRRNGTGDPEYLTPQQDFLAANDPTLQICNESGGVISMDGYMQAIWGREPFYKRTSDGSLALENGQPVFNDITGTKLYGCDVALEKGEAEHCLQDIYRQATRIYLMYHWYAGEYPANSEMRKPFLKNTRIGAWTRITNEGLQGIEQNDRPLPGWLMQMLTGMYMFTADDLVVWSSDTNTPPGPLGADYTKAWKYNTHGVFETIVKAAHRYSALDPIHKGPFRWCWFRLPLVNKNLTAGDRYFEKPIVFGKLRTFEGKPWLELFAAFPALDGSPADMQVWLEKDGKRSRTYTIRLANGRSYFYDAWQLPAEFKNAEGKDVWLRFKDALGATHTWRGDWREAAEKP